jgi:lipoprotein-anchoring transpeptidase ErfK/SrfK
MRASKAEFALGTVNKTMGLLMGVIFIMGSLYSSVIDANTFVFNPKTLQWKAISSNGQIVRTGHGSGGRAYCPDTHRSCRTPTGTFHVIGKGGAGCKSSRYPVGRGGSPMPYCMYFSKYYAVHGSYEVPHYNASHGCIRVQPSDARWLYSHFMSVGTTVVVKPY